jgi:hypothetical protein
MSLLIRLRKKLILSILFLIPALAGTLLVFGNNKALAANPNLINFQGKVVNGTGAATPSTNVTDGSYTFRFCLYTTASPSTPCSAGANNDAVWRESKSLTVANGVFQTELGDTTTMIDVSAYTNLYLGINFNSDAAGEMTPRIHLDSVPYALNSDKLGGLSSSGFIQNTTNPQSSSNFNISGTGVAGTALQAPIVQTGSGDLALQPASGIVALNRASTNNELRVYENAVSPSNYASISATSSDATFKSSTGTTKIGNGTGAITIGTAGTTAVNITGHATSVWQTDAGSLTVQGGTTLSLLSTSSNAASFDSGSSGNVNIGTGATGKAVAIGNSQSGTTVTSTAGAATNTLSNTGNIIQTNTNSAAGFGVKNSSGISLFNIDTSTNNSNNLVTNPSFETATMWTAKVGSGASATSQASSPVYDGTKSMQVTTSSTATNAGASFTATLTLNATYVMSLYVKANTTNFSTFQMGYTNTGGDNNCFSSDQTVTLSGWTRLSCSFTVTTTAGTAIYVKQTDATGRTFFVDDVLLETDANASGYYKNGLISLQGTVNSPLILQNTSNSANAFLVQNSSGSNIFGVDTTDTNLINNPGVEVNTTGWSYNGTAGSAGSGIFRDTSNSYVGNASLKLVTDADATEGAKFTFSPSTALLASTTYVLSFYAKDSAGSYSTLTFGRSENGSQTSCITTGSISTTWQRYSCSFAVGATIGASPYVYVLPGAATSKTIYIDGVSLEPGSTASPYGAGSIYLNGVISSPVNFQNKTDSTTAFQVQNSTSTVMLAVDSANKYIQVGSSTTDATAVLTVLDSYNNGTDPTNGVSGAMYYNTSTSKFRCYQSGAWANCISSTLSSFTLLTSTSANSTYTVPSGVSTIMVELIGSGAAGGSSAGSASNAGAGGGGGAGGYARKIVTSLAASYNYTIGVGGTAGAAGNNSGGNGNPSCFGTNATACTTPIFTCAGGTGGSGSGTAGITNVSSTGGAGGTCTSGDVSLTGATGGKGSRWSGTAALSGNGADTTFGMGGQGTGVTGTGDAASAGSYGAGGGGGLSIGNTNSQGGAGRQGVIIVWEFK